MQKILLVKTSSLGDLIHTMPAISDLQAMMPDVELHWLVEEGFADIPLWHPFVKKVHKCAIRRWRKTALLHSTHSEIKKLRSDLRAEQYDCVVDAQGLLKSALMVRWLKCPKYGYDNKSIKEPIASYFYTNRLKVDRDMAAIERVRQLFAQAFSYSLTDLQQQFSLKVNKTDAFKADVSTSYFIFLHGTIWNSKIWPLPYWKKLAAQISDRGFQVYIPWGNETERLRAETIANDTSAIVLPKISLNDLAYLLQNAQAVIGSDTGLSHVAAALDTRTIAMYGPTSVALTGLVGCDVHNLQSTKDCSPCLKRECPVISASGQSDNDLIPCYESVGVEKIMDLLDIN